MSLDAVRSLVASMRRDVYKRRVIYIYIYSHIYLSLDVERYLVLYMRRDVDNRRAIYRYISSHIHMSYRYISMIPSHIYMSLNAV